MERLVLVKRERERENERRLRQGKENEEKSPTLQKSPLYNLSHDTSQETRIQEQEREGKNMRGRHSYR